METAAPDKTKNRLPQNADGTKTGSLVPVNPNDAAESKDAADQLHEFTPVTDFLLGLCNAVNLHQQADKVSRRRKTVKLRNYICGNYLGYVDERGVWQDKSSDKGADSVYYDPETATYIDVLVASVVKSKPVWKVVAASKEKVDIREAAKVGQLIFDDALRVLAPAKKVQREVKLNLIAAGETYRFTYFNPNRENSGFYKSKYEPVVSGKDKFHGICLDCRQSFDSDSMPSEDASAPEADLTENIGGKTAAEKTAPETENTSPKDTIPEREIATSEAMPGEARNCPNCQSPNTSVFKRKAVVLNVKKGEEFINVGDVESDFVDPLEMIVVGDVDNIASALAVQRNRMLFRCILEETYGAENVPPTGKPEDLSYQNQDEPSGDESSSASSQTTSTRNQFEKQHLQLTWLAPTAYASYKFDKNTLLKGGKFIKKGTPLTKIFPRGLCVSRIGEKIVNLYAQATGDCWSHSVNAVSEGFHGIGEWDISALQDQLNNVSSMKMNSLMNDSTSPLIYRSKYVTGAQLKNKIGLTIPISDNFQDNQNLSEIATRLPTSGGVPEAYELAQDLRQRMVNRTGAMTQAGGGIGEAEAATKTATGYRLWYEHTLGRRAPMLTLRAEMIMEQGYQILEMKQKYLCEKMFEFAESEASGDAVKWFMRCNIRRDIRIEVAPDSWMPQSEIQQKADFAEFMAIITPFAQAKPELIDRIIERISENYSAFDLTEHAADTTEGQIRLESLIEIAEFAETQSRERGLKTEIEKPSADGMTTNLVPNPVLIDLVMKQTARDLKVVHAATQDGDDAPADPFSDFPLDVLFDDHTELERTYTDYLKTASGRRASLFVRACVQRAATLHRKASFELMRQMKQLELSAQEPELQAGMIASDEQHQQQMAQNEDLANQQLEQQGKAQMQSAAIGAIGQSVEADATEGMEE